MIKRTADVVVTAAMAVGVIAGSVLVARSGANRPLACVAYYALPYPGIFAAAPVLLSVYTVVSRGGRLEGVVLAIAYVAAFYLAIALVRGDFTVHDGVGWQAGFLTAVVVIGPMVATHRAYLREVELRWPRPSARARRSRCAGPARSGCGSPRSCTTLSPTRSRSSTSRPGWPRT